MRFELADLFDVILVEGELGFGKPDERVYKRALTALGVKPADAWMVGDNLEWDVAAPQKLGMSGVWIDARGRGLPVQSAAKPDYIVRSLAELRALIEPSVRRKQATGCGAVLPSMTRHSRVFRTRSSLLRCILRYDAATSTPSGRPNMKRFEAPLLIVAAIFIGFTITSVGGQQAQPAAGAYLLRHKRRRDRRRTRSNALDVTGRIFAARADAPSLQGLDFRAKWGPRAVNELFTSSSRRCRRRIPERWVRTALLR